VQLRKPFNWSSICVDGTDDLHAGAIVAKSSAANQLSVAGDCGQIADDGKLPHEDGELIAAVPVTCILHLIFKDKLNQSVGSGDLSDKSGWE
jgi:hypothetical protein